MKKSAWIFVFIASFVCGCIPVKKDSNFDQADAKLLPFSNDISSENLNIYDYHYLYNGGGVAIADLNNDNLPDIVLGGNMKPSVIFINKGNLEFIPYSEDVGFDTEDLWVNGISIVDINYDDRLDIYLSVGGPACKAKACNNKLYINKSTDGELKFEESATVHNLNIGGYSQQGIFFDADGDGDLDLYQLQNFVDLKSKNQPKPKRYYSTLSYDKFFVNQLVETGELKYQDQSTEWGVSAPGFGLGVALTDFNNDGYPDIYVANDFITDDILYVNQEGKRFVDQSHKFLKHTSYNSMGVDIADINNDTYEDIMVVDMLPYDNLRKKTMLGGMNYDKYLLAIEEGYNAQYIRNTLQLHGGLSPLGQAYAFLETGQYYKIHQTDWSWAPLISDFNNDTYPDIFITNGYGKNITDLDFINYNSNNAMFGSDATYLDHIKKQIKSLPAVHLSNEYFINVNTTHFERQADFNKGISNGAAYGDLDNDGDLDLVLNNLNAQAEIIPNQTTNKSIKISLKGSIYNTQAIGAQIKIFLSNGTILKKYHSPVRSYMSSMDPVLLFGIGSESVKKVEVVWPDRSSEIIEGPFDNYLSVTNQGNSKPLANKPKRKQLLGPPDTLFFFNKYNVSKNFSTQPLLLRASDKQDTKLLPSDTGEIIIGENNRFYKIVGNGLAEVQTPPSAVRLNKSGELLISGTPMDLPRGTYTWCLCQLNNDSYDEILVGIYPDAGSYPRMSEDNLYVFQKIENQAVLLTSSKLEGNITDIACSLSEDKAVVVGEWMPPTKVSLINEKLELKSDLTALPLLGLWQSVLLTDLNNDGKEEIVLGNIGENTIHRASTTTPLLICLSDLDGNGKPDPILSQEIDGQTMTYHARDDIAKILPLIKRAYPNYKTFAEANYYSLIESMNVDAEFHKVNILKSVLLQLNKDGQYEVLRFPDEVQYSVMTNAINLDINNDGREDLILGMNDYNYESNGGNIDGSNGIVLINRGDLKFDFVPTEVSGFYVPNGCQDIEILNNNRLIVVTDNSLLSFELLPTLKIE